MDYLRWRPLLPFLVIPLVFSASAQTLAPSPLAPVTIALDSARQIFHLDSADAMGLKNVPDQHTCIVRQPDSSYQVYLAGVVGTLSTGGGATALLSTRDFLTYTPVVGTPTHATPVLAPTCPGGSPQDSCAGRYDADYAGANLVWQAANGKDLLMLYYAGSNAITDWAEMALARSTDNGRTWNHIGPVISSADPKPAAPLSTGSVLGVVEGGGIVANGYIYAYYAYFPNPDAPDSGRPTIQAARAPLSGDGAPGTWTKYYNGAFGTEPGLGGRGSPVVPEIPNNRRPAQPWPAYSTYLNEYVLILIANDGWFFSTSKDLVTWSQPVLFYSIKTFQTCEPNDDNVVLVTPGNPGQVLGKTGYAVYAHTPHYGFKTCPTVQFHELWIRGFDFSTSTSAVETQPPALPIDFRIEQNFPNPFNPSTTIRYDLPRAAHVRVTIFNTLGQVVASLVDGDEEAGSREIRFDASGLASGVYFCRLEAVPRDSRPGVAGSFVQTRKLIMAR